MRFGRESSPGNHHVEEKPIGRVPRVARLLALAHHIDGLIRTALLRDWAEAAKLIGITRARMTQIANLLLLAPAIQESLIGSSPGTDISGRNFERSLRAVLGSVVWQEQTEVWPVDDPDASLGPIG